MTERAVPTLPHTSPSDPPGFGRVRASLRLQRAAVEKRLAALRAARPGPRSEALGELESIEHVIEAVEQEHVAALGREGLGAPVIALLRSWLETTVDARLIQRDLELSNLLESELAATRGATTSGASPLQPLSAVELGQALGLGDEAVRQREYAGELFSVLRPGRKRGREFPAFQAWPEIAGEPLKAVLAALQGLGVTAVYSFFSAPTDLLGGLTPIEALAGHVTSSRALPAEAETLLSQGAQARLAMVVKAAGAAAAVEHA